MQATTRQNKLKLMQLLKEKQRRLARKSLLAFTRYTKPDYSAQWFHKQICQALDQFDQGHIKKLMIWVPPQHGKSELSTRRYPAYTLGKNPNQKLALVSYNHTFASKFNRDVQRIIDDKPYNELFPGTYLNESNVRTVAGNYLRNNDEFEIVGATGSLVSVGVGGGLTGRQLDKLIIDDLYKDAKDAWSPTIQENVWEWYTTVAETRLHNDSQQCIVFTRWHENDLAGKLLAHEPDEWHVIKLPAIKEGQPSEQDPRQEGAALWPEKHNREKLLKAKKKSPVAFANMYQQDPKPAKGLLYSNFMEYQALPDQENLQRYAYVDSADTGADYTCCICYIRKGMELFIIDVFYSSAAAEETEPELALVLKRNGINNVMFESNNGGRALARNVERISREAGNHRTAFSWFHQSKNKIARIHSEASTVLNTVFFPEFWHARWPEFHAALTSYSKEGKNKHDDAPDALTGAVEQTQGGSLVFV